jgi:hypothetical protein
MIDLSFIPINSIFGLVGVALGFVAYVPYFVDTLKGRTTPHVYTWFILGTLGAIGFGLQAGDAAGAGAWVTLAASIMAYIAFGLGLRLGNKQITWTDTLFFVLALLALFLWLVARQPLLSVIMISVTDLLGFVPTIRKAWQTPYSETALTFRLIAVRQIFALLAIENYTLVTILYPAVVLLESGLFSVMLSLRRRIVGEPQENQLTNPVPSASAGFDS